MEKTVNILWTGGWDSTYRVVELSRMEVVIQPLYVLGDGRASEQREIAAIDKITKLLQAKPKTKATFLPVLFIKKDDIPENKEITEAFRIVHEKTNLGTQHEWLARYAAQHPGLEIGTEAGTPETSHIINAIQQFGVLLQKDGTYILDPKKSSREGLLVLGNFEFPIIDKYEIQMLENIKAWGYEDVMKEIWFCHKPIDGQPCGLCHPCAVKMESNMKYLLPEKAQTRYKLQNMLIKLIGKRYAEGICSRIFRNINRN